MARKKGRSVSEGGGKDVEILDDLDFGSFETSEIRILLVLRTIQEITLLKIVIR
jgi:hypothetical protein